MTLPETHGRDSQGAPDDPPVVLVVDDDLTLQLLVQETLTREGFRVESAFDGDEGLAAFGRVDADLVLLDVNMPGMDGFTVCAELRRTGGGATAPVVMMTALDDVEAIHRAYWAGATDFITKPITWALLPYRLRYLLRAKRALERVAISEARLARAQRVAQLGTWELDLDTGTMDWSAEAARIVGLTGAAPATGKDTLWGRVHPDDRVSLDEQLRAVIERRATSALDYRLLLPEEGERTVHQHVEVVLDHGGRPWRLLATIQDVSERRQLEAQLRQVQKMEAVGRLAGGIAHDFNNLLTVINGRSALLLRGLSGDAPARRELELIQETGERAAALTRQLLAFSRRQDLHPARVDLNEVIENMRSMVGHMLGEDIDVVLELEPRLAHANADGTQVEQVVLNLMVNARDAMPRGGRLTVRTENVDLDAAFVEQHVGLNPGPYVMLTVGDTGVGMTPDVRARIFEPFFTTKRSGEGTGLGLATVYGVVTQHRGCLTVDSEPGRGSTFRVYLPRVDEVAEKTPAPAPQASARGYETVLIAEDDEDVRALTAEVLRLHGYATLVATGTDALRIGAELDRTIDLLVTDVVMPEVTGPELRQALTATRRDLKVLYLSGHTDDALRARGFEPSGAAFLRKPFTPDVLARKVREILETSPANT